MKVVNIESVIQNLEDHLRSDQSSRLLFRQRRNINAHTEAFNTTETSVRNLSRDLSPAPKKYIIRQNFQYRIDNSLLKQLTIKESLRGLRTTHETSNATTNIS